MVERKSGKRMGRPRKRTESYRRTTLELPDRLLDAIKHLEIEYGDFFTEVGYNDPRVQEQLKREREEHGNGRT